MGSEVSTSLKSSVFEFQVWKHEMPIKLNVFTKTVVRLNGNDED